MKVKTEFKVLKLPLIFYLAEKKVSLGVTGYNIHSTAYLESLVIFPLDCSILSGYLTIIVALFIACLRFLRRGGIGLKFLLWPQLEIGTLLRSSQKRRDHQLVTNRNSGSVSETKIDLMHLSARDHQ